MAYTFRIELKEIYMWSIYIWWHVESWPKEEFEKKNEI